MMKSNYYIALVVLSAVGFTLSGSSGWAQQVAGGVPLTGNYNDNLYYLAHDLSSLYPSLSDQDRDALAHALHVDDLEAPLAIYQSLQPNQSDPRLRAEPQLLSQFVDRLRASCSSRDAAIRQTSVCSGSNSVVSSRLLVTQNHLASFIAASQSPFTAVPGALATSPPLNHPGENPLSTQSPVHPSGSPVDMAAAVCHPDTRALGAPLSSGSIAQLAHVNVPAIRDELNRIDATFGPQLLPAQRESLTSQIRALEPVLAGRPMPLNDMRAILANATQYFDRLRAAPNDYSPVGARGAQGRQRHRAHTCREFFNAAFCQEHNGFSPAQTAMTTPSPDRFSFVEIFSDLNSAFYRLQDQLPRTAEAVALNAGAILPCLAAAAVDPRAVASTLTGTPARGDSPSPRGGPAGTETGIAPH